MSREDLAKMDGVVKDILSGGYFDVTLDNGAMVRAQLSGKLKKFRIRVIRGDRVSVGMSPYDMTHGLILKREKL